MKVAVVGSGPGAVAAARALVDGGLEVDVLDFGNESEKSVEDVASRLRSGSRSPEDLAQLRPPRATKGLLGTITHMSACLLGRAPILDMMDKTRLGSRFALQDIEWGIPVEGKAVAARSLARGGLSNIWGAASYPLSEEDYSGWPVRKEEMDSHYEATARMLSLLAQDDELAVAYPTYGGNSQGLPLNPPAKILLDHWRANRDHLIDQGILAGRARLSVRVEDAADGRGCQLCGLCLYGCPYDSIYRAEWTLCALARNPSFRYLKPLWVHRFEEKQGRVLVEVLDRQEERTKSLEYDAVFLAAGTLSSLRIAADAQGQHGQAQPLMDNDLYLVPFVRTARGPVPPEPLQFTLNELALRVTASGPPMHVQLYCMSDQIVDRFRPLLRVVPRPLRRKVDALLARFLVGFIYLPGEVSAPTEATVQAGTPVGTVSLSQRRRPESRRMVRRLLRHLGRNRRALGLRRVGPAIRSAPAGPGGGHLVGSLPMKQRPGPLETYPDGRLYGTDRVYVVDGAALPRLPPQNSTYTIMANAHRIGTLFAQRQL